MDILKWLFQSLNFLDFFHHFKTGEGGWGAYHMLHIPAAGNSTNKYLLCYDSLFLAIIVTMVIFSWAVEIWMMIYIMIIYLGN